MNFDIAPLPGEQRWEAAHTSQGKTAKQLPANVVRAPSVTFTYADLGEQDHWRMIKLFFGEGDGESEVFLNLNPTLRQGQFSIKDSDYGDAVLAELAKVL